MQKFTLRVLAFFLVCAASWNAAAEENIKPPDYIQELKAGKLVKGKTVDGDDIIKIIQETADLEDPPPIKLEDCIIEKGLDFTQLPIVPIQEVNLPEEWDEKRIKAFTEENKTARVVKNEIKMTKCEIKAEIYSKDEGLEEIFSIYTNRIPLFFYRKIGFAGTRFEGYTKFIRTSFSGAPDPFYAYSADFSSVSFSHDADFSWANFSGYTSFRKASFSNESDFSFVTFSRDTDFYQAKFHGDTCFSSAIFSDKAKFNRVSFSRNADFFQASFCYAFFSEDDFKGDTNFTESSFKNAAFDKTTFEKIVAFNESSFERLNLSSSVFKSYADFRYAGIRHLDFNSEDRPVIIEARMDFRNAEISAAHFQDVIFQQDVDFSDTQFGYNLELQEDFIGPPRICQPHDYASLFRFVTFESDVSFIRTKFENAIAFEKTNFKKEADFKEAEFKHQNGGKNFGFSYVSFNKLKINWEQLPEIDRWVKNGAERVKIFTQIYKQDTNEKPECLSEVLKALEENFRSHNQLDDANEAYFHMKEAERKELEKGQKDGSRFWAETEWLVWGMICGYGTNIWWALGWSLFFIIAFALLYMQDIERDNPSHAEIRENTRSDYNWKQRILEWPWLYIKPAPGNPARFRSHKFINALRFSFTIFFKFGPRDSTISGKIICFNYLFIIWIEWLLGFYMLACMFYTLSNSMPLLNTLLRGVF